MAVSFTDLTTAFGTTNQTSITTASITPTADRPVAVFLGLQGNASPLPTATISGAGLTWSFVVKETGGGTNYGQELFVGSSASPSAGALTITFNETNAINIYSVIDLVGADPSGTIVQTATGAQANGTAQSVTLGSFASATNGTIGCLWNSDASSAHTIAPGSGLTELVELQRQFTEIRIEVETKTSSQTTVDWTTTANAALSRMIAAEIKEYVAAAPKSPLPPVVPTTAVQQASNW